MAWEIFEKNGIKGFTGDKPFDELAIAVAKFGKIYENEFSRKPTVIELLYTLDIILKSSKEYISDPENLNLHDLTNSNNFMQRTNNVDTIEYEGAFADRPKPGYHVVYRKAIKEKNQPEIDVIKIPFLEVENGRLICKYEILSSDITDIIAQELILVTILEEFADNYYKDLANEIVFTNIISNTTQKIHYK